MFFPCLRGSPRLLQLPPTLQRQWQEVVRISAGPLKKERVNKVGWVVVLEGVGSGGSDGTRQLHSELAVYC